MCMLLYFICGLAWHMLGCQFFWSYLIEPGWRMILLYPPWYLTGYDFAHSHLDVYCYGASSHGLYRHMICTEDHMFLAHPPDDANVAQWQLTDIVKAFYKDHTKSYDSSFKRRVLCSHEDMLGLMKPSSYFFRPVCQQIASLLACRHISEKMHF